MIWLKKTLRYFDGTLEPPNWVDMPCLVPILSYGDWTAIQVYISKGLVGWYCLYNNGDIVPPRPVAEVWKALSVYCCHNFSTVVGLGDFIVLVGDEVKAQGGTI